jgi:phospholipid/cholesterol/gamma-HCH transport system substrate-binding protein
VTPARRLAGAAAAMLLLCGCGFKGLDSLPLPGGAGGPHPYHVTVEFADVLDLVPQSAVKVDDVTVGSVEKVWLDGWHARVRLRIAAGTRLPDNAVATIRQTSLLGEKFVSLAPPGDERPAGQLADGDVIPLARSGRNVEVEELLSALSLLLNGGGVAQLKTIEHELNQVLAGREDSVRDLLGRLDTLLAALDQRKGEIVRAIGNLDHLSRTLAAQRRTIAQALERLPPGLQVLADERARLTGTLTALARLGVVGAQVVNASRADLIANLKALRPILTTLNQAGGDLPAALELLVTFPFPRRTVDAIHGDYTNLRITADLDLADLYGNLLGGGAGQPAPAPPPAAPRPAPPPPTTGGACLPVVGCLPTPTTSPGGGGPLCPLICIGQAAGDARLAAMLLGPLGRRA